MAWSDLLASWPASRPRTKIVTPALFATTWALTQLFLISTATLEDANGGVVGDFRGGKGGIMMPFRDFANHLSPFS